jgi:hypothetical protein
MDTAGCVSMPASGCALRVAVSLDAPWSGKKAAAVANTISRRVRANLLFASLPDFFTGISAAPWQTL